MPYALKISNGELLVDIPDGAIDFATTSLNLVGKNVAGYGFYQNTNFLHLLENFSNETPPDSPIKGQIWYDTKSNRLNVYNGVSFKDIGDGYVKTSVFSNELHRDTVITAPEKGMIVLVENVNGAPKFMGYLNSTLGWVPLN